MKRNSFRAMLVSAALLMQTVLLYPAENYSAAAAAEVTLENFAASVRAMTALDADKPLYDTLTFDTDTGTLSVDGERTEGAFGTLSVRGGRLMLRTGGAASGRTGTTAVGYTPFAEAAASQGYTYTQEDGTLTIRNSFQTARLIVKAEGEIPHYGALQAAEGYRSLHILQYADAEAAYEAYRRYEADPAVEYVQPSQRVHIAAVPGIAAGSYNTWGAGMIGVEEFCKTYLDLELLPDVTVAVIDTGLDTMPAIFDGRVAEGGINISDSGDDTPVDDYGHGTHCSGTICELTPSNVQILPVKVFDVNGDAADEQIYLGIVHAIEHGADVLNMSFGGLGVSPLEIEALTIAEEHGVICCAASGNNADDASYYYPGGIESCITVGAVDSDMQVGSFSNYGKTVDVVAPGVGVLSYVVSEAGQEMLESWNGTSMATPHAAACCALLRSYDKTITPDRAERLLQRNAIDLGEAGFDPTYGWGLVSLRDFQWDDGICKAPEFSLKAGNYGVQATVSLTCDTPDVQIYYTTDGTLPTAENGKRYEEPLHITETTRVYAIAMREGYVTSSVAEAVYMIGGKDLAGALHIENGVLTRYNGVRRQFSVPEGVTVTAVAANAFAGNAVIEQVTLPDTVTSIGDGAFAGCAKLNTVTANGVTAIGASAFSDCALLAQLTTASKLTAVGKGAFADCSMLTELDLTGIRALPNDLCKNCTALEKVTAPDAVTIGSYAFSGCAVLEQITLPFDSVTEIGASAMAGCKAWQGKPVLSSLETLGEGAFSGDSSLLRVTLPERIEKLPAAVFAGCSGLQLLELPGVTQLADSALAIGNPSSSLIAEIHFSKITKVGADALNGFPICSSFETVTFSALKTIGYHSFAGVSAGGLAFPQVTAVPQNSFAGASVGAVYFEQAASFEKRAVSGCTAVVLSKAAEKIDPEAFPEEIWICTLDKIPTLENLAVSYNFCDEPLVLAVSAQNISLSLHAHKALQVFACGVEMGYQWYLTDGETRTAIVGAESACYVPDTSEAGVQHLLCVMTDRSGKTEQVAVTVEVTAEQGVSEQLLCEKQTYARESTQYAVEVEKDGIYTLFSEGGAPIRLLLTDSTGRRAANAEYLTAGSRLSVPLRAGERYILTVSPMWEAVYTLLLTASLKESSPISDCTLQISGAAYTDYGAVYTPEVTVTSPAGQILSPQTDYEIVISQRNQWYTVGVFGVGAYTGYAESVIAVYPRVPVDTPIPVELNSKNDAAVYAFVPRVSGKYYYNATYAAGYAEEMTAFYRRGTYPAGAVCAGLRTKCIITDRPDGTGTIFAQNSYNSATGGYFGGSVELKAGQTYYFICTAGSAGRYSLVLSQDTYDLRKAKVQGVLHGFYEEGKRVTPSFKVTLNGETLTEGNDYLCVYVNNDVPGNASVMVVGTGLYYGSITKKIDITYLGMENDAEQTIALGETVTVESTAGRPTALWFTAESASAANASAMYRVVNEVQAGGEQRYVLYRFDPLSGLYSEMQPISENSGDYELKNGTYCLLFCRVCADVASRADVSVVIPHSLDTATVTVGNAVYTGDETEPQLTVTAEDGTVLEENLDYTISYPDGHTLFGETRFALRPTARTYGAYNGTYEVVVSLPKDAPYLTEGAHSAMVTLDDRLAVYRVTADSDTIYTLASSDAANIVLRVFSPEGELLAQDYGNAPKSVSFDVPSGAVRYVMVKFNGTARWGTIAFQLSADLRLLGECAVESKAMPATGERVLPEVTFTDGEYTLVEDVDYTLRYTEHDVRIGTATANYVGIGRYFGVFNVDYQIVAPDLFALSGFDPYPIALDTTYRASDDLEDSYLIAKYTAGFADTMLLSVFEADCNVTVQRYTEDGSYADSIFLKPSGTMEFDLAAGETCYLLFAARDVSSKYRSFRFSISDPKCPPFRIVSDAEHGASYRVFAELDYAEVYKLDLKCTQITLLPVISGMAYAYVPEGLFTTIPDRTVVFGYEGCAAAEYADRYGFAYQQLPPAAAENGIFCDCNGDGACTMGDAVLLSHMLAEHAALSLTEEQLSAADLNKDGILSAMDLRLLLEHLQKN